MPEENKQYPHLIVGAFIFNEKQELLMVKAPKWNDKYVVPGGHVELGETMEQALRREISEETGLEISDLEFMSLSEATDLQGKTSRYPHMVFANFYARADSGQKILLNEEGSAYKWQSADKWLKEKDKIGMATLEVLEGRHFDNIGLSDKYRRALADYQNLLKRTAQEKEEFAKYAQENSILAILPVLDNLKISLQHVDKAAAQNGWAEGIKLVVKQFSDILEEMGVREIEALGRKFDHNFMEAVEGQGEKVKAVVKPGYTLKGKVIVPARVVLD